MQNKYFIFPFLAMLFLLWGCDNEQDTNPDEKSGAFSIRISHTVDHNSLITNNMIYTNAAGNEYMVTEVQWFISNLKLVKANGDMVTINDQEGIFYIDTDVPESLLIMPADQIPVGDYSGIAFTFGFDQENNTSNRFVNPPESFMFWPVYLGGGYHYLKLNGKWINQKDQLANFNFHLGIGQLYDSTAAKSEMVDLSECCAPMHCEGYTPPSDNKILPVIEFIQNHFEVILDNTKFSITEERPVMLELEMKIENWFESPHVYDHNQWGGSIMQNQQAMHLGCENGHDVFELNILE